MKLTIPNVNFVIDTEIPEVNTIIIENQEFFYNLLCDIQNQINGSNGKVVLSQNNKPLELSKYLEIIDKYVPFELSQKSIVNKIISLMESEANSGDNYLTTVEILSSIEKYFDFLSSELDCKIDYTKLNLGSVLKAVGIEIFDDSDSLAERLINYIELVNNLIANKMFIFVNLRTYLSDDDMQLFIDTVVRHSYNVLLLETSEKCLLKKEKRYIIDQDLCEIVE